MRSRAVMLLCAAACGSRGVANQETGLVGVSTREGSLAGTWAQVVESHTLVPVPVLGDKPGGGRSTRLVTRTWDGDAKRYTDTFIRCTNVIFAVEGVETIVRDETLAKIAPSTYTLTVDAQTGAFLAPDTVDLWGVHNLPDPAETSLPTKNDYTMSPQSDWVWDEDEDGEPGVTIYERGAISAKLYVVKRSVWTFDGTVIAPDRVQGLVQQTKGESNSLGSTVDWLKGQASTKPDPSQLSWFDAVRLSDGAGCDAVADAVANGKLSAAQPF